MSWTLCARRLLLIAPLFVLMQASLSAQPIAKARVAELIVKVENGIDDFEKYLERRGENAQTAANAPARNKERGRTATQSQKAKAEVKKDELDEALDGLDRSTNRLRRRFDATDNWIETKVEVERMIDDGRKINQAVTRGSYGSEVAKLWSVLRNGMNDLARVYNVPPLGI